MRGVLRLPYPTNWMLGVADTAAIAERGVALAHAQGGGEVRSLVATGASIASLGRATPLEWLLNLLRHVNTDQAADLVVYESARVAGRTIVAVHALGSTQRSDLAAAWRTVGMHFVAHYGTIATEDWDSWRGEPLASVPTWAWR